MPGVGPNSWKAAPPGNLPAEMTSFVGRRQEIAEVRRLMAASRAVTLIGVGGVGKTRLALRIATDVRRAFPDGVCLIELAGLEKPELLVQSVSEALEIQNRSSRPPIDVLIDHVREKRMLLLLDNCEHLLPDCAVLAETLLRSAPELRVLATSRQALGISGEQTVPVPTLPPPDAAVLFADRGEAVLPGFAITAANHDGVEQICQRLDGMPLAIELAAVRLRALSVSQLLSKLNDRFSLLTTGSPALLPRQQTLRAVIDWSYALCTGHERTLWARASVFVDGLDLDAAEEVCSGDGITRDEVVELVIGLVDKSVLLREEHPAGVRYRLLETIRQYGLDRLKESGGETRLRRRHRDWYQNMAISAEQEWFGPDQVEWFARLRSEHGNLRMALEFCLRVPGEIDSGAIMASALRFYWLTSGFLHEGRRWLDRVLAADPSSPALRARVLTVNARLATLQSDFGAAAAMLDECRALADDDDILGRAAYVSGLGALIKEDLTEAITHFEEAVERNRRAGNLLDEADSLLDLATAHSFLGHSDESVELFEACLKLSAPRNENWFTSFLLTIYAVEVWKRGDPSRAIEMERQSIRLKRPFDDRVSIALSVEVLAWITADLGESTLAAQLFGALGEIWRSIGGPPFDILTAFHEQCEQTTRDRLGIKKFEAAFNEGTALSLDQTITLALEGRLASDTRHIGSHGLTPLTPREAEIARLISQGMSNKDIAATLVIAQRTAEGHVENILGKLGFSSRIQIAAWVRDQEQPELG